MVLILDNISHQRAHWLKLKETTIGSSEIATVCGLNKYKSPLELWAEKTGKVPPFEGNDATFLGTVMEHPIALFFERKTGIGIDKADCMYQSDQYEWATASPDYWIIENGEKGILECKNKAAYQAKYWDGEIPFPEQLQVQWQLGITGLKFGYLAVNIGSIAQEFKTPRIEYSPEVYNQAIDAAMQFMEFVKKDIPPSAGVGDKKVLEMLIKERQEKTIKLPDHIEPMITEYLKIKADRLAHEKTVKSIKEIEDGYEARLLQYMEDANEAVSENFKLQAITVKKEPYTTKPVSYTLFKVKEVTK